MQEAQQAIGETLDNSTTDNVEGLTEDFFGTLINMPELDLTEDQAWDAAYEIAQQIWEHPESVSAQDLNQMVNSSLLNLVVMRSQQNPGIQDPENIGGQVFNSVESFLHEHDLPTMEGTYRLGEQFIDYTVDGIQSVGYSGEEVGRDVGAFLTENNRIQQVFGETGYIVGLGLGIGETALSLVRGGKKNGNRSARNRALHERHRIDLAKQQQMRESGKVIAGAGHKDHIKDISRLKAQYGGKSSDWVKKTSTSYEQSNGNRIETHWYENTRTGKRYEFKTKKEWPE